MIYIDFQGGQHGNYLEFVCNRFLANIETIKDNPFNSLGASHDKFYLGERKFNAWHYFDFRGECTIPQQGKLISIRINEDDLLPLSKVSLLRAADLGLDNDDLENNTYHKLMDVSYRRVLNDLINGFFKNQVSVSYSKVKDESWPEVNSIDDFNELPEWIKAECLDVHCLKLMELSSEYPDCPRWVLREFFKESFAIPGQSGFFKNQSLMIYSDNVDVLEFPFGSFYETERFIEEVERISEWTDYTLNDYDGLRYLHSEFLERQPYKFAKLEADEIINRIIDGEQFDMPKTDLLTESYLCAKIELHYDIELEYHEMIWPKTSCEFRLLIEKCR